MIFNECKMVIRDISHYRHTFIHNTGRKRIKLDLIGFFRFKEKNYCNKWSPRFKALRNRLNHELDREVLSKNFNFRFSSV